MAPDTGKTVVISPVPRKRKEKKKEGNESGARNDNIEGGERRERKGCSERSKGDLDFHVTSSLW